MTVAPTGLERFAPCCDQIVTGCHVAVSTLRPLRPQNQVRPIYPALSPCAKLRSMTTPYATAEHTGLPTITPSMLDGYLAAVASGPNFAMSDQVLRWVSEIAAGDKAPESKIGMPDQTINNLIIRHYQAANAALNDQIYAPDLADPQAWCRGYMAGVAADMMAWEPLMAAQPELLKVIMSEGGDLADAAKRIHEFWVVQRLRGTGLDLWGQLAGFAPGYTAGSNQPAH